MNPSASGHVLIIDDEESMLLLLSRLVQALPGVEVTLASSGDEAVRLAASRPYDAILLDLLMPGIGGIEVLKSIRTGSQNMRTPVVIVSVLADSDTLIVCQSLGISNYIVKPVVRESLLAAVKAQLAKRPSPAATGA